MDYQQTLDWLFQQLASFQRVGQSAYNEDLGNINAICSLLNHPQNNFKSIHVAGTNGKGSTSHLIASVLQEQGYKVGLYTSPHLKDFRERIKVNGETSDERVFTVDSKPSPATKYARAKLAAEHQLLALSEKGLTTTIIRSPAVYGPEGKGNINSLVNLLANFPMVV